MQETQVHSLGQKDPLEKEMATHSSILAWRIPWTEESGGPKSMGLQTVGHDRATEQKQKRSLKKKNLSLFFFGCAGSSLLCIGFLYLQWTGAVLRCGGWASHCGGFSSCGTWALGRAQQLWHTDFVTQLHVKSSQTRNRTRVLCIGRWFFTTGPPCKS